mgnify:CR=1 FL=1
MTKIKKTMNNGKECLHHEDITMSDIATLWFSTKQITYWNYEPTIGWSLKNMFNNNIGLDVSNYVFTHVNENIIFFKLHQNTTLEDSLSNSFGTSGSLMNVLKKNDTDELNKYFINIKVCKF